MHPNAELIRRFYEAFEARDADFMASCYADQASFGDAVFPDLDADAVRDMWRMLCEAKELKIEASEIVADDQTGSARWDAWYAFPATGRAVHNIIRAEFRFKDGKIVEHRDSFDFVRWSNQALGRIGGLLARTAWFRGQVQGKAAKRLEIWRNKRKGNTL